ncbi:hypothetical protein AAH978_14275 [Streptomyces sp. ZYX-F-203]
MGSAKFPHLGFDPAPGDPAAVEQLVTMVGVVIRESGDARTKLNRIGTVDGVWVGDSATAFAESVSVIPPYLGKSLNALESAHRALSAWESGLSEFRARARRLEREAAEAASRVDAERGRLDGLPSDTSGMTDTERDEHARDVRRGRRAYDAANDELEAVRARARSLNAEFTAVADVAARQVRDAADDAPPEPGLFDGLVEDFREFLGDAWDTITDPDFWKLVGDVLADIAMVIGVICLVALLLGTGVGALGLVGFAVGVGALAAHGVALAGGAEGMTWETLAWDVGGVLTGGVGLAGARLAQAGRALVQSGRALRASRGLMAAVGEMGPGNHLKGIAQIPSGVTNSVRGFSISARGWTHVAIGNTLDWTGALTGTGLALGSNANDSRWTDGEWNLKDVPLVGPFAGLYADGPADGVTTPGPPGPRIDSSRTLRSAGASFTSGLALSRFGTVA